MGEQWLCLLPPLVCMIYKALSLFKILASSYGAAGALGGAQASEVDEGLNEKLLIPHISEKHQSLALNSETSHACCALRKIFYL